MLVSLEEESTKKDEEVENKDADGIDGVTEEFMVCLTVIIVVAQSTLSATVH